MRLGLINIILIFNLHLTWGQVASFQEISSLAGINNQGENYGVAIADYDNDGDEDIYITRQYGEPNILYQNDGNANFINVADALGIADEGDGMVSIWGDTDNDGDLDLYIGNRNGNDRFFENDNGVFTDITFLAGIQNLEEPRSLNFSDIDNDGDLDLYVVNFLAQNKLYINQGNNLFLNSVYSSGALDAMLSMGAISFDYDNDGDQDLYLTRDGNQPFVMYQNDGVGSFTDVSESSNTNIEEQGMGVDIADINLDGHLDIYVTNLYSNSLLLNNGDGSFTDITETAGVGDLGMGWGTFFFDYDNDGYADIYVNNQTNVFPMENNVLYRNNHNNTFSRVSDNTIMASPYGGIGAAYADFNNDGLLDVFLCNQDLSGNQLFLNQDESGNNWIKIKLQGTESNINGIGARIEVHVEGLKYMDEVTSGSGYASQNSLIQHFGLGNAQQIELITVQWPSGHVDSLQNISINQQINITENEIISNTNYIEKLDVDIQLVNPSPKHMHVLYQSSSFGDLHFKVIDLSGKIVFHQLVSEKEGILQCEIPTPGNYFIQFTQGNQQKIKQIMIY